MRTTATLAALLFLILLVSFASAQTPTPTETISSTALNHIRSTSSLTGTVTASHGQSFAPVIYNIFLQNAGTIDLAPFTMKITNTMPYGHSSFENYPECETGQDMCSSAFVESLSAGESITLTIEHSTVVPLACGNADYIPSFIQQLRDLDEIVENSIDEGSELVTWTSNRSVKAVAVFDQDTIVNLQVPEPLIYNNELCFENFPPEPPTPMPSPTSEPSALLLPWFANE